MTTRTFLVYFFNENDYEFGHRHIGPRQVVKCINFIERYIPLFQSLSPHVDLSTFYYKGITFIVGRSPFSNFIEIVLDDYGIGTRVEVVYCSGMSEQQKLNLFNIFNSNKQLFGVNHLSLQGNNIFFYL